MPDNVKNIPPRRLKTIEHCFTTWFHTVNPETDLKEVLAPEFWAHVAAHLNPHDRIVVDWEDASRTVTLFVRATTRQAAAVAVQSDLQLDDATSIATSADNLEDVYAVKWGGPSAKYRVIRVSDDAVLKQNFPDKISAWNWARHNRTVTAA